MEKGENSPEALSAKAAAAAAEIPNLIWHAKPQSEQNQQ